MERLWDLRWRSSSISESCYIYYICHGNKGAKPNCNLLCWIPPWRGVSLIFDDGEHVRKTECMTGVRSLGHSAETPAPTVQFLKEGGEEEAHLTISLPKKQLSFELRGLTGYFRARGMLTMLDSSFGKTWLSSLPCLFIQSDSSNK